ncbi:uncharacterized mitochondrial protein AtMg00810-like [Lolium perenne]|uniref:uncharacterized mitochondrial protein AtMg00810-like n=1 Tax=Lolium perenne TaxID=4522 RepID=UPI0021F5166F|nr:uncharacterized mitochondrial protein AtMg00810-like [Lolium perenne]
MYLLIYADDIILVSSSSAADAALISALGADFAVKDLGQLHFFLGIEVAHQSTGLNLTQKKYSLDLLRRAGMLKSKMSPTPMSSTDKFSATNGYLTITRPDLSFVVNGVCQYLHAPTDVHWSAVKRILRYTEKIMLGSPAEVPDEGPAKKLRGKPANVGHFNDNVGPN